MNKLKVSEIFSSIQGEGVYTGVPSVFVRMFGCNFRCKNFGRIGSDYLGPSEKKNPDVIEIIKNIDKYDSYRSLPVVATGCDSYGSVYPEFSHLSKNYTPEELAQECINLLPNKKFKHEHLVVTGGEPLLGWQKLYPEWFSLPEMQAIQSITIETNGTQTPSHELIAMSWEREILFSISPKLPCSGEAFDTAIKPEVVAHMLTNSFAKASLKFVVSNDEDVKFAEAAIAKYHKNDVVSHAIESGSLPIYFMPVGGTVDQYTMNARVVAELALARGYRFSDRLHVNLWKNAHGT